MASSSYGVRGGHVKIENEEPLNPIIIISDDEEEEQVEEQVPEEAELQFPITWEMRVTKAVANLKKAQVVHFPRPDIARAVEGITRIRIKSDDTRFYHPAYIMTSGRKYKERYIGRAWYAYVAYHKPRPGDIIRFTLHNPPNSLYVKLLRKPVRSKDKRRC